MISKWRIEASLLSSYKQGKHGQGSSRHEDKPYASRSGSDIRGLYLGMSGQESVTHGIGAIARR